MLPVTAAGIRLTLHILGACVWIGGQFVLVVEIGVVRAHGGQDATRAVARRFGLVAWPAFGLLVATGIWNLLTLDAAEQSSAYMTTLMVKLGLVVVSGAAAAGHTALTRRNPALGGILAALALAAAIAAAYLGVLLTGS
mgnify:CR=1 FL=1